jgi:hypothetical protein
MTSGDDEPRWHVDKAGRIPERTRQHSHHAALGVVTWLGVLSCAVAGVNRPLPLYQGEIRPADQIATLRIEQHVIDPGWVETQRDGDAFVAIRLKSAQSSTWIESIDGVPVRQIGADRGLTSRDSMSTVYHLLPGKHRIGFWHSAAGKGVKHIEGPSEKFAGNPLVLPHGFIRLEGEIQYNQKFKEPVFLEFDASPGEVYVVRTDISYRKCKISILKDLVALAESHSMNTNFEVVEK